MIQQIYSWELSLGIIGCVIGVGVTIGAALLCRYAIKHWEDLYNDDKDIPVTIGLVIGGLVGPILLLSNLIKVLKIAIVPKLYLVNYIADLLSSSK